MPGPAGLAVSANLAVCSFLAITVYFQAAFTFQFGGNVKLYNLLLPFLTLLFFTKAKIPGKGGLLLFVILVVGPVTTFVFGLRLFPEKLLLFGHFPRSALGVKDHLVLGPLISMLMYVSTWGGAWFLLHYVKTEYRFNFISKVFVWTGLVIALYTAYGYVFVNIAGLPDLVPNFLDNRNYTPDSHLRIAGLSQEPGDYVYLQTWAFFILLANKQILSRAMRAFGLLVIFVSMALSLSTNLIVVGLSGCLYIVSYSNKIQKIMMAGVIVALILWMPSEVSRNPELKMLFSKATNFFAVQEEVRYQFQLRPYHTQVGLASARDHLLLGVGVGDALAMMVQNDRLNGLQADGPKNSHVEYMLENGIVFYACFVLLFVLLWFELANWRTDPFCRAGLVALPSSFVMFLSLYPAYHFFLWFPVVLAIARLRVLKNALGKGGRMNRMRTENAQQIVSGIEPNNNLDGAKQ